MADSDSGLWRNCGAGMPRRASNSRTWLSTMRCPLSRSLVWAGQQSGLRRLSSLKEGRESPVGVQIDLLIQTDRSEWIVEVKRRHHIGREIEKEIADKVSAFPRRRGMSIRTALIHSGELDPAVTRSGAFDAIIPFSRLLGLED